MHKAGQQLGNQALVHKAGQQLGNQVLIMHKAVQQLGNQVLVHKAVQQLGNRVFRFGHANHYKFLLHDFLSFFQHIILSLMLH